MAGFCLLHLLCKPNLIESPLNLMARKIPKETEKSPPSSIRNEREQVSPVLVFKKDGAVLKARSRTRLIGNSKGSKAESEVSATVQSAPMQFKSVFDHTSAAIAIILPSGRFLEVNAAYRDLMGYSLEEFQGMVYTDLIEPDNRAEADECFSRCIRSEGNHPICSERPYVSKTGVVVWCESSASAIRDDCGNVIYIINHLYDVTFRNRAVLAAMQAKERKNEFLAMLGHELRNPLNAIRHALQAAMESHDDPYMMEWTCGVVNRQSLQLSRMVDDLLDVARVNMRDNELLLDTLDLRLVLSRAQTAVRHLLNERGLNFISNDLPPLMVYGDEVRLEQVFVNLLHNAIKFTPEGGFVRLTGAREGTEIVVSIADSGIGIAPEMVEQIFELFRQVSVPLARSQGGLGIGLTVVKSLVEMHGGRVAASSLGLMKGAKITVRLPELNSTQKAGNKRKGPPSVLRRGLLRTVRVLVVEDNADTAEGLRRLLVGRNCEVRVAKDGLSGMRIARKFFPEVLLLDLGLPGLDGYQMVKQLRADPMFADSLFIAVSGYAQEADRTRALEAGFEYHCAKPLDFQYLMSVIRAKCVGT